MYMRLLTILSNVVTRVNSLAKSRFVTTLLLLAGYSKLLYFIHSTLSRQSTLHAT
jgi:hypothetical protein